MFLKKTNLHLAYFGDSFVKMSRVLTGFQAQTKLNLIPHTIIMGYIFLIYKIVFAERVCEGKLCNALQRILCVAAKNSVKCWSQKDSTLWPPSDILKIWCVYLVCRPFWVLYTYLASSEHEISMPEAACIYPSPFSCLGSHLDE